MTDQRHGVAYDVLGAQCASWDRGIARLTIEVGAALVDGHRDHIHSLCASEFYGLTPPVQRLLQTGLVHRDSSEPRDAHGRRPAIYHVASPFEVDRSIDVMLPPWARAPEVTRVATVYDLIPMLFADKYLPDPQSAAWYRSRITLLRSMDHLLTISDHTRQDLIDHLGIPPERATSVHTGVDAGWARARAVPRAEAMARLRAELPELADDFVFYVGGPDSRKNVANLVEAWLRLGAERRAGCQLVIGGNLRAEQLAEIETLRAAAGLGSRDLMLTGYIDDDALVRLYRCCRLFAFPSRYEGAGLPMLEAMATGAVVVGARNSSIREILVDDEAMFDADDADEMGAVISRHLTDDAARARRRAHAERIGPEYTWARVADRTAAVYEAISQQRSDRRWRPARAPRNGGRRAVLVASGSPESQVAPLAKAVAQVLANGAPVEVVSDRRTGFPEGTRAVPVPVWLGGHHAGLRGGDRTMIFSDGGIPSAFQWPVIGRHAAIGVLTASSALGSVIGQASQRHDGERWLRGLLQSTEPGFAERFGPHLGALWAHGYEQGLSFLHAWSKGMTVIAAATPAIAAAFELEPGVSGPPVEHLATPALPIEGTERRRGTLIVAGPGVSPAASAQWVYASHHLGEHPISVIGPLAIDAVRYTRHAPIGAGTDVRALAACANTVVVLDDATPATAGPLLVDAAAGGARAILVGRVAADPAPDGVIALSPDHLHVDAIHEAMTGEPLAPDPSLRPSVEAYAAALLARCGG